MYVYTRTLYYYFFFFPKTFSCYRTKGFSGMPFMSTHNTHLSYFKSFRIIHLGLDIVTVGLTKNICYQLVKPSAVKIKKK